MMLFIDFETTGLPNQSPEWLGQPGICQIGAIKVDGDAEVASFNVLVNPEGVKWSDEAIKVHGITPEQVGDAPTFFEIGPALARFALGCRVWAGYNTNFDRTILWHQLNRYGLERSFPWPPEELDVMKLAARQLEVAGKRGVKNVKLVDAYEKFTGKLLVGAHDALADIRATFEVWRAINAPL